MGGDARRNFRASAECTAKGVQRTKQRVSTKKVGAKWHLPVLDS